jgi:hypothetical protein
MEQNMTFTDVQFKGQINMNGVPIFNHDGAPFTVGGYISTDNTETAYFGRVVSADASTPREYLLGVTGDDIVIGILQNDYAIRENSPFKADYLLAGLPATVIFFGMLWLGSWTHAGTSTRTTPQRGDVVIFKNTTGQIEFLPKLTAVPSGYTVLDASVMDYDADTNKVLLFMGISNSASETGTTPEVLENTSFELLNSGAAIPGVVLAGGFTHGIDFSAMTTSTNTDGTLMSTGSTWINHATAGSCAIKFLISTTATSGDFATMRLRARSDAAWTSTVYPGGVAALNASASASINDYGGLTAIQAYCQPGSYTQASASSINCALYGKTEGSGTNAGRVWDLWIDTSMSTASAEHYMARLSHNGGAINLDGFFTLYQGQGVDYLFNFENATNAPLSAADKTGGTKNMAIHVKVGSTSYWIQLYQS